MNRGAEAVYPSYKFWKDLALCYIGKYGIELANEYQSLNKEQREGFSIRIMKGRDELSDKELTKLKNTIRRYRTAIKHHICGNDYKTCQVKEGCDVYRLCRAYYGGKDVDDER